MPGLRAPLLALCLVVPAAGEVLVRYAHLNDVPLYLANDRIGYIPAPNQSGAFMRTHRWAFNSLSMGTASPFRPSAATDVLLLGDSIVLGGNPYRQEQRLGPQLENVTRKKVWPISAGSWGLQNELQYVRDHPDVLVGVDQLVFVLNSGDFDKPSSWASELTHPRTRPRSSLLRLIEKYVLPARPARTPPQLQLRPRDNASDMTALIARAQKPIDLIFYPNRKEEATATRCGFTLPSVARLAGVRSHCLKMSPGWSLADYSDDIHPTVLGTRHLALFIKAALALTDSGS